MVGNGTMRYWDADKDGSKWSTKVDYESIESSLFWQHGELLV